MKFRNLFAALILSAAACAAWAADVVNINAADAQTLAQILAGIGPNKAAAIVHDREVNGPFPTVDSLSRVQGIGKRTVEINRERISLD